MLIIINENRDIKSFYFILSWLEDSYNLNFEDKFYETRFKVQKILLNIGKITMAIGLVFVFVEKFTRNQYNAFQSVLFVPINFLPSSLQS